MARLALIGIAAFLHVKASRALFALRPDATTANATALRTEGLAPLRHQGCQEFDGHQVDLPRFTGEFGHEITIVLPVAYFLHLCGALASTQGCGNMSAYYWFSTHHSDDLSCSRIVGPEAVEIRLSEKRLVDATYTSARDNNIHSWTSSFTKLLANIPPVTWHPVPYLPHYFDMPALKSAKGFMDAPFQLVIFNKYTPEWGHGPVNYIDFNTVQALVDEFSQKCGERARVLYVRDVANNEAMKKLGMAPDWQAAYNLIDPKSGQKDVDWVSSQSHAETMQEFYAQHSDLSMNEAKLRVLSRASCFIGVQGGASKPVFLYGGKSIILQKAGREVDIYYNKLVPQFAGQSVEKVSEYSELLKAFRAQMLASACSACKKREAVQISEHPHYKYQILAKVEAPKTAEELEIESRRERLGAAFKIGISISLVLGALVVSYCCSGTSSSGLLYCLAWIACTSLLVISNKWIFEAQHGNFPFSMTLTSWHMLLCTLTFAGIRWLGPQSVVERIMPAICQGDGFASTSGRWCTSILPVGIIYAVVLGLGNYSYVFASVSLMQMTKASMGPIVACIAAFVTGTEPGSASLFKVMSLIAFGAFWMVYSDVDLAALGIGLQVSAIVFENIRLQSLQILFDGSRGRPKMDSISALYLFAPVALLCTVTGAVLVERPNHPDLWDRACSLGAHVWVLNGILAVSLNVITLLTIEKVKVLTFVVAGIAKDILVIVVDVVTFKTHVSAVQVVGLVVTLMGLVLYKAFCQNRVLFDTKGILHASTSLLLTMQHEHIAVGKQAMP